MTLFRVTTFIVLILALTRSSIAGVAPGLNLENGQPSPLQLSENQLPKGWSLDTSQTTTSPGTVNQWAYFGPNPEDKVEITISTWGERANQYLQWKQGMVGTGQYNIQTVDVVNNRRLGVYDDPASNQMIFTEKNGSDKQVIIRVGPYLVEMHCRGKTYPSQAASPIKPDNMLELAGAFGAHLSECAIAAAQEDASACPYRRVIVEASQTPNTFINGWPDFTVPTIEVGEYQRAENFQVVGGNTDTFAIYFKNSTRRYVYQRRPAFGPKTEWAGIGDLRLEPGTYAVSCNIAENGRGNIVLAYDLVNVGFQWERLFLEPTNTGGSGSTTGSGSGQASGVMTIDTFPLQDKIDNFARPPEIANYTLKASWKDIPSGWAKDPLSKIDPAQWVCQVGHSIKFWTENTKTGREIPSSYTVISGTSVGHMEGNTFVADQPGVALLTRVCSHEGFTIVKNPDGTEQFISNPQFRSAFKIRVVPADAGRPGLSQPWTTEIGEIVSGAVYQDVGGARTPVEGAVVTLDLNGGEVANTRTDASGHYGFKGTKLGTLFAGTYELRAYKRTAGVSTDLWNAQKQTISLPLKPGQTLSGQDIRVITAKQKFGIDVPTL